MALGTLVLAEGALAELFMTAHALAVEGVHASWNQLLRALAVADGAVGIQRIKAYQTFARQAVAHLDRRMAGGAARMNGIFRVWRRSPAKFFVTLLRNIPRRVFR